MLLRRFKEWREAHKWASFCKRIQKKSGFSGEKLDALLALISDKKFPLFLEFLELTISEKLVTFSSIDILNDSRRVDAIKLQQQMRGVMLVADLVRDLIDRSKESEEDEKEH